MDEQECFTESAKWLLFEENICMIISTFFHKILRKLNRRQVLNFNRSKPINELVKAAIL